MARKEYFAHPKALIEKGAMVGKGTRVWAFAHILAGARIGERCNICDFAFVETGATVGNDVTVKNGVHIWEGVTVGDGVFLGPHCVFTNDRVPRSFLKRPKAHWLLPTALEDGCTVGANATVICGVSVGRYAFVAAGATVTRDVPAHALVAGTPARITGWVCRCGLKLSFWSGRAACKCGQGYRKESAVGRAPKILPLIPSPHRVSVRLSN